MYYPEQIERIDYYTPAKRMFSGIYWNHPVYPPVRVCVRPCVCVSVLVENTSFFQSPGGGIKIHLMTALFSSRASKLFSY